MIAYVACDGAGEGVGKVDALLGVSVTAASPARARGRRALAELGWDVDDALTGNTRLS